MKRLLTMALMSLFVSALFADEDLDFYTNLFNNAETVSEQLTVIKTVAEQGADAGSLYKAALGTLLAEYPSVRTPQDLSAADELAALLAQELGKAKYTDAAVDLWRTVHTFASAIVKSEALIALGNMQATDYLPHVVQTLKDVNTRGPVNRLSGERIAYAAIVSLESYNDPSGYLPVFFAANGWYSNWVKKPARETLSKLQEDPAEQLTIAITDPGYTYEQKLLALQSLDASETDDANKAKAASSALNQGWSIVSSDAETQRVIIRMRKLAVTMIAKYGADQESTPASVVFLNRSYRKGHDVEEQFAAIDAFAKIASDDAVKYLGTYVTSINERHARKVFNQADERRIRALITGLGNTHNANAKPYLQAVLGIDWTKPILKLAQNAVDNL